MRNQQKGFATVEIIIAVVMLAVIGVVGWKVMGRKADKSASVKQVQPTEQNKAAGPKSQVSWGFNGSVWMATGTPPACPDPLVISMPVSLDRVKAVLYPGQTRGGDYKAHGGFLLTTTNGNDAEVKLPLDATPWRGSRYIEKGEVQYLFDFINSCGIMYRFDHILTLSSEYQKLADTLPTPQVDASGTTNLQNVKPAKKGDVIATAVGFKNTGNVSFDMGVYDLRKQNEISKNSAWASRYQNKKEQSFYAVCWLDMLGPDSQKVKSLPGGDGQMGKTSDYCK